MEKKIDFDLWDFLPYLLNQAAEQASLEFQKYYKDNYGMLRTEWRVLFHVGHYKEISAKDICEKARIHKTKVSRAVSALEKKRFLSRIQDDNDRRHEKLSLTKTGRIAFDDLSLAAQKYDAQITNNITTEERKILRSCLKRIAQI